MEHLKQELHHQNLFSSQSGTFDTSQYKTLIEFYLIRLKLFKEIVSDWTWNNWFDWSVHIVFPSHSFFFSPSLSTSSVWNWNIQCSRISERIQKVRFAEVGEEEIGSLSSMFEAEECFYLPFFFFPSSFSCPHLWRERGDVFPLSRNDHSPEEFHFIIIIFKILDVIIQVLFELPSY